MPSPPETSASVADHVWQIEDRELRRHELRRGRRHAYEKVDPRRTALVVVDMVPFFVEESAYCRGIIPRINLLAEELRAAGGTVAWVVPGYQRPTTKDLEFYGPEIADLYARSGGRGTPAERLAPQLIASSEHDVFVEKTASSAFFPNRSALPDLLDDRGIDTIAITGTVTNVCVEASVRDASTLGYRVILVADACAANRDQDHNATLHVVYRTYGDVRPTEAVVGLIRAGA